MGRGGLGHVLLSVGIFGDHDVEADRLRRFSKIGACDVAVFVYIDLKFVLVVGQADSAVQRDGLNAIGEIAGFRERGDGRQHQQCQHQKQDLFHDFFLLLVYIKY